MSFEMGGVSYPTLWAEDKADEPTFLIVRDDEKAVGLADLMYLRDAMQDVHAGDLDKDSVYSELYIRVPGRPGITQCIATIGGTADKAELVIHTAYGASELWRCEL